MTFVFNEPWILFTSVALLLFASSAAGFRIASLTRINEIGHHHEQITGLRDGLFVLLGLLLAFMTAMALPRFDQRQELVVEEANAIRATALRAQLLPEPQRSKTLDLLRQYALVRENFAEVGLLVPTALSRNIERTRATQDALWQQILGVAQANQSAVVSAYLASLTDAINLAEQRLALLEHRVPREVWGVIITIGAFQSFVTGYNLKQKFWPPLLITPIVVSLVMAVIVDIDSPRTGFIRIEQNSMERLVNDMGGSQK